ncbi:hypothetical protein IIC65_08025 [Candidatus Sumerlaeota bacterium]|nr:hypothetical protein [Candidatus Sumerlaeota bacterium]
MAEEIEEIAYRKGFVCHEHAECIEDDDFGNHGILQGMSGSPVFIDGKMIGAIAYAFSFSYYPYAGITPIEHMLTLWDALDEPRVSPLQSTGAGGSRRGGSFRSSAGWDWEPDWEAYLNNEYGGAGLEPITVRPTVRQMTDVVGTGPVELVPLSTPIYLSNFPSRTSQRLRSFFAARGLRVVSGAVAGSNEHPDEPSPPIIPGSSLGIPFMTGDAVSAGFGTVSYRQGNKLVAFGHPMFSEGAVDMPLSQAYVIGLAQNYNLGFKLYESREIIGAVRQDREFSIGAIIGPAPERVEMTVSVGGEAASHPRSYHYSIWKDRITLPQMAAAALDVSFQGSVSSSGEMTADCRYTIHLTGGGSVTKTLRASSRTGISFTFLLSLLRDMFLLVDNPYAMVDVESIEIEMEAWPGFRIDTLDQAVVRYGRLRPGDRIDLDMIWRPYRGEEYTRRESLELPKDIKPGVYVIHVADASTSRRIDQRHEPALFRPHNLEETIEMARRAEYPSNRMKIYLFEPGASVSLGIESMEGLPASMRDLIRSTAPRERQTTITGRLIAAKEVEFDYPITARTSLTIEVLPYLGK